jgi:hypothetical protein
LVAAWTRNRGGSTTTSHPTGRFLINTVLDSAAAPITLLMNWAARGEEVTLASRIDPHWSRSI